MPNDCFNHLTIVSDNLDQFNDLFKNEFADNKHIHLIEKGDRGLYLVLLSAWKPNYKWLNGLVKQYPGCRIKNEWNDEGGTAGIWIAYQEDGNIKPTIKSMQWKDLSIEDKTYYFYNKERY